VYQLRREGYDAVHTLDLPVANRTSDAEINRLSIAEDRIVITKDADFVDTLIVQGVPYKLLLISTGNIRNSELERLFFASLDAIVREFSSHVFIELNRRALHTHY